MKQAKQRVITLDYFRGLCILIIVLSHSSIYTSPYAYLSGMGRLWVSAAEFFFLLSGLTLGVVRGGAIVKDFKTVTRKSWARARDLYLLYLVTALATVLIIPFVKSQRMLELLGAAHLAGPVQLLTQIATFHYSPGLANFLMYYAVYLIPAPLLLYALYKYRHAWSVVLALSAGLYAVNTLSPSAMPIIHSSTWFATWQLYFVIGMVLARFRPKLINLFYGLNDRLSRLLYGFISSAAAGVLLVSAALGFGMRPILTNLTNQGWLPHKLLGAYTRLLWHKPTLDSLLMDAREGILRPVAVLIVLSAGYLVYQRHKETVLKHTGRFVTAMGRETLWVFVAQAMAVPLLSALPLRRNLLTNTLLTLVLFGSLYAVAVRRTVKTWAANYLEGLRLSYNEAKYSYLQRDLDSD